MAVGGKMIALPLAAIAALGAGMYLSWQGNTSETYSVSGTQGRQNIPSQVGGLKLTDWTAGQEAVMQVTQLHGMNVGIEDAYIAEYQGAANRMTAWVARANSVQAASGLLTRMTERIKTGNPTYTNLREVEIEGHPVYSVDGQGREKNFYYEQGPWVIWLTISGDDPLSLVADSVAAFPSGQARSGY